MKNLTHIEIEGVILLADKELKEVNGGFFKEIFFFLLTEFDSIKQGWNDASSGKEYNYNPCGCK